MKRALSVVGTRLAMLAVALTPFACGGNSVPTTPTPTPPTLTPAPPTVSSMTVLGGTTPSGTTLFTNSGQTSQFTATARLSNGTTQDVTAQATWSSANTAVATVNLTGVVTAIASGTTQISATYQGVRGTKWVGVTAPASTLTVSGIVVEEGRPVENAGVTVELTDFHWRGDGIQIVGSGEQGGGITDASGHYRLFVYFFGGVPGPGTLWAETYKDGYVQQCAAKAATIGNSATLDVRLTSTTNLSTARPRSGPDSRTVSGVVYETTATGRQPVQGATVAWEAAWDESYGYAHTLTDAAGFYLLCGLPQSRIIFTPDIELYGGLYVFRPSSPGSNEGSYHSVKEPPPVVEAGTGDVVVDIELTKSAGQSTTSPRVKVGGGMFRRRP